MRIVIDLQSAQGAARWRGIGRYSLSLALATARQRGDHEVIVALSDLFPDAIEPMRLAFDGVLPHDNIRVWHAPGPELRFRGTNELMREAFLAELRPDIVHVAGLVVNFPDVAPATIARFTSAFPTAVTLYDLIPRADPANYLTDPALAAWYRVKLDQLKRATLLLAISESARREALEHLALRPEQIVTIMGAADPRFRPVRLDPAVRADLLARLGINRPFVMYTGGEDHRKNMAGIVRAFARLPEAVRHGHQLVLVGALPPGLCDDLRALAAGLGLADEIVLSGQVSEDDLLFLYNACTLFVFPSLHEGLGLPILEAMSCGAPVIASNTTSMPEVIGRDDALFDPRSDASICAKILEALTDRDFRAALARHGLERAKAFSWDDSARRAVAAFERIHAAPQGAGRRAPARTRRPRLAYVSPWPPDLSGIADVSAELLPELSRHYEIELITSSKRARRMGFRSTVAPRSPRWLRANRDRFDRVLYQFGNSHFHSEMFDLLPEIPGTVALHDFFLGHVLAHREVAERRAGGWSEALYRSHGYPALRERAHSQDPNDAMFTYPANLGVLQHALGVIVHSHLARQLAARWYGGQAAADLAVVPLLRALRTVEDRTAARRALGLPQDAFVVGCFGILSPYKLDDRVLAGWLASSVADDPGGQLVFVGGIGGGYGEEIRRTIERSAAARRVRVTGYVEPVVYHRYLAAVDVAVQLRAQTRGETSAAVLDCMGHGLPTIVNACGTMAELPHDAVWMLPEQFDDATLAGAVDALRRDPGGRAALGERAREVVRVQHDPASCADAYANAIERFHGRARAGVPGLIEAIAAQDPPPDVPDRDLIAAVIAANHPVLRSARRLFIDVSALVWTDLGSGVQRVTRSMLLALLSDPPDGFRVEPVYATAKVPGYRYARRFTCELLESPSDWAHDEIIEPQAGDVYFGLDLHAHVTIAQAKTLDAYRQHGVRLFQLMYDLLPVRRPDCFYPSDTSYHTGWLHAIAGFDGVVGISRAVAEDFVDWLAEHGPDRERPLGIGWCHLGGDLEFARPTRGMAPNATEVLRHLRAGASFLVVGTIEPRKGVAQTLAAFERLWAEGLDHRLVLVGRRGWKVEPLVAELEHHPELGRRLIWLPSASDEYLAEIYAASTCLIAPSEGEGFGLPLVEAARHGLPILARDIPVFREVAGDHAAYFEGATREALAAAVQGWLASYREGRHPRSDAMPWLTWRQSTRALLALIMGDRWPIRWRRADPAHPLGAGDQDQSDAARHDIENVA